VDRMVKQSNGASSYYRGTRGGNPVPYRVSSLQARCFEEITNGAEQVGFVTRLEQELEHAGRLLRF